MNAPPWLPRDRRPPCPFPPSCSQQVGHKISAPPPRDCITCGLLSLRCVPMCLPKNIPKNMPMNLCLEILIVNSTLHPREKQRPRRASWAERGPYQLYKTIVLLLLVASLQASALDWKPSGRVFSIQNHHKRFVKACDIENEMLADVESDADNDIGAGLKIPPLIRTRVCLAAPHSKLDGHPRLRRTPTQARARGLGRWLVAHLLASSLLLSSGGLPSNTNLRAHNQQPDPKLGFPSQTRNSLSRAQKLTRWALGQPGNRCSRRPLACLRDAVVVASRAI